MPSTSENALSGKIFNRTYITLLAAGCIFCLGMQISIPMLSMYADSLSIPDVQTGALVGTYAVVSLLLRFVAGPTMKSINNKLLAVCAIGTMSCAYLGFAFAPAIAESTGIAVVNVLRFFQLFQGVGSAFAGAGCTVMVTGAIPRDKFSKGLRYYISIQVVFQALGPTVGMLLRNALGYRTTYILSFVLVACGALLLTTVKYTSPPLERFKFRIRDAIAVEALIPAFILFFFMMGYTTINSFLLLYAENRGIQGCGFFYSIFAVAMLLFSPLVNGIAERVGTIKSALFGGIMSATALVMIALSTSQWLLYAASIVAAFGYGSVQPSLQSISIKSVPPQRRGSAASTSYISADLSAFAAPTICGFIADKFGYTSVMWYFMVIPALLSMVLLFMFRKRVQHIEDGFLTISTEGTQNVGE